MTGEFSCDNQGMDITYTEGGGVRATIFGAFLCCCGVVLWSLYRFNAGTMLQADARRLITFAFVGIFITIGAMIWHYHRTDRFTPDVKTEARGFDVLPKDKQ